MTINQTDDSLDTLARLLKEATPGPWEIYSEEVPTKADAKRELCALVDGTEFVPTLFYLTTPGPDGYAVAPAVAGCGRVSASNAALIAHLRNLAPALVELWKAAREYERASTIEVNDKGAGGFALARLSDLRAALCALEVKK